MAHNKVKVFNTKLYAVITTIAVAVFLVAVCVFAFASRYTAFHPDELARIYVDSIVQSGDGYNAYKYTLVSKNSKYGDFIRENYIDPVIYREYGYKPGEDKTGLTGYNNDSFKSENTLKDDGSLAGELIEKMYPVYEKLIEEYGWDDYDSVFTKYLEELVITRKEVFGDKYISDEVFFAAFEANVSAYGKKLTGTEDTFDENTGVQLTIKQDGLYEKAFGEDYRLIVSVNNEEEVSFSEYMKNCDADKFAAYNVNADDISEVRKIAVDVITDKDEKVASAEIFVVKAGMSWYVDNTITDTSSLYGFYK